jgi:hypothetical protein
MNVEALGRKIRHGNPSDQPSADEDEHDTPTGEVSRSFPRIDGVQRLAEHDRRDRHDDHGNNETAERHRHRGHDPSAHKKTHRVADNLPRVTLQLQPHHSPTTNPLTTGRPTNTRMASQSPKLQSAASVAQTTTNPLNG